MKKFLSRFASKTALDQADFWQQRWAHQADYAMKLRKALKDVGEQLHSAHLDEGLHRYHTFEATDTVPECPESICANIRAVLNDVGSKRSDRVPW